jgi:hypothetical protein
MLCYTIIGRKHKGNGGHTHTFEKKKEKAKETLNLDLNPRYLLAFQLGLASKSKVFFWSKIFV